MDNFLPEGKSSPFSISDIRNIYCVGRNYRLHAAELGNAVPDSPMLFTKPTHAAVALSGSPLILPGSRGTVHYEAELVLAIGRTYERGINCADLISAYTVGLDLTLREVQDGLKAKGHPWLAAKGFRNAAPLGSWLIFQGLPALMEQEFGLLLNGKEVQRGNPGDMVFGLQELIDFVGVHYGLGEGDILYTGTPAGVGSLQEGDKLELWWKDIGLGKAQVKLEG